MSFVYMLGIAGTFAFALSGALVAKDKDFDIFGVLIIAFVTAVGGGMLRDVLINAHPINWIGDLNYLWAIFTAVIVMYVFKSKVAPLSKTMFLFDAIGLSVFTLLGLEKGLSFNLHPIVALIMGMVSAVFGSVIRDVLTREIPLIFKKEIYASACLAGGLVYLILEQTEIHSTLQFVISATLIFFIRFIASKFHLELPKIDKDIFGK